VQEVGSKDLRSKIFRILAFMEEAVGKGGVIFWDSNGRDLIRRIIFPIEKISNIFEFGKSLDLSLNF
jgi:hypothetical protein